ncbi:MAG: XrtA/PEP-CTERM system histidine kinase PrsK, partial [Nitrospinota bacterium]
IFVSRYVVYNSITVLVVSIYLIAVGVIAQVIKYYKPALHEFFSTAFVFISLLIVVVLGFTAALRRKVQLLINRNFFKHKYEFRDRWMETIEKISLVKSPEETCRVLLGLISKTVPSEGISLWLQDHPLNTYQNIDSVRGMEKNETLQADHPLIKHIKEAGYPFLLKQERSDPGKPSLNLHVPDFSSGRKAVLCVPLLAGTEVVGFLLLGKDISGFSYVNDDFEILHAIATQTAVQLKNLRLAQDLAAVREVEAFYRLSSFIIHDLKNLTNSLSLISQNARHCLDDPEFQKDAMTTIDYTVAKMKGLIKKFSSVPKGLEVKKKKTDVHQIIQNVLKTIQFQEEKNITFAHHAEPMPQLDIDPEAMEMVFTNLVLNAYDSIIHTGKIDIKSRVSESVVSVFFADTGRGMSEDFLRKKIFKPFNTTKKGGFGIGLFQCKTIVEAHNGTLEVESRLGKGSVFTVTLPVQKLR